MSTIQKWLNEEEMPGLTHADRLISLLYTLGISTREQIATITGWSDVKVSDTLKAIRAKVPTPEWFKKQKQLLAKAKKGEIAMSEAEIARLDQKVTEKAEEIERERNKWLMITRANRNEQSFYTLGEYGVQYACDMRREPYKRWKIVPNVQARHFLGINEILCRLRRAGVMETEWLSGKETEHELFYHWKRLKIKEKIPYKPDACLELKGEYRFFLEYDTGSENDVRLRGRFRNCLKLYNELATLNKPPKLPSIVWVTTSEKRKEKLERIAKEVLEEYRADHIGQPIQVPESYCFVEGEDTKLFTGELEAETFWP